VNFLKLLGKDQGIFLTDTTHNSKQTNVLNLIPSSAILSTVDVLIMCESSLERDNDDRDNKSQ